MYVEYEFGEYYIDYFDVWQFLRHHLRTLKKEDIINILKELEDYDEFHELTVGEVLKEVLNIPQKESFEKVAIELGKLSKEELIDLFFDYDLTDELEEYFKEEIVEYFKEEAEEAYYG